MSEPYYQDEAVRTPPSDIAAEEAVLGSLLIDPQAVWEVVPWLKAEDFYREKNRWAYEACLKLNGKAINQITVAHELAKVKRLEAAGGSDYLSHLVSQTPTSVHVKHYGQIVKGLADKRRLISAADQIAALGYSEDEDALLKAQECLSNLHDDGESQFLTPTEWADFAVNRYAALFRQPGAKLTFGLPWLDERIGGMHKSRLIIVGARPSVGKTTLLVQFGVHASISGNVLFASAEESIEDVTDRLVGSASKVPMTVLNVGNYDDEVYGKLQKGIGTINESRIYLYSEGRMTTAGINATARQIKLRHGLDAIFVDYLQLLRDKHGNSNNERVSYISAELKAMARVLDVPVVVACQLNRETEHGNKIPKLHELRDSGSIEQDADLVVFLYRADAYVGFEDEDCPAGQAKFFIAKHRHGGKVGKTRLRWLPGPQRYGELEQRSEQ